MTAPFYTNKIAFSSTTALNAGSQITMPALSSTMKEGRVVSWLKSEGDEIEAGEAIMVVESDKADMDVEAFEDGFLAKIVVEEGEVAPVGQPVALIASSADEIDSVVASFGGASAEAPAVADGTSFKDAIVIAHSMVYFCCRSPGCCSACHEQQTRLRVQSN